MSADAGVAIRRRRLVDEARRWWQTDIIDVRSGRDRAARLPDRGAHRARRLRRHDLADAARRAAVARAGARCSKPRSWPRSITARRRRRSRSRAWRSTCGAAASTARWRRRSTCSTTSTAAPGQQCMELYLEIDAEARRDRRPRRRRRGRARSVIARPARSTFPGFGHRFHPLDPRTPRLLLARRRCGRGAASSTAASPRSAAPSRTRSARGRRGTSR